MIPDWADQAYTDELPFLRARGEGSRLEYMREFPGNATELGKEIAAFASTDGGIILLGVTDAGNLRGLPDLQEPTGRDALLRRLEGVCHGMVKPSITPSAVFAVEDEKVVLVIRVPRGEQPVYYCHGRPYVRHLTQSRPAEPHEVYERIARHATLRSSVGMAGSVDDDEDRAKSEFISELAPILRDLLLWANEADERPVNPGLRDLMFQFEFAAEQLRLLASTEISEEEDLRETLSELGDLADAVAHHQHTLGRQSREEFLGKVSRTADRAREVWSETLESVPLAPGLGQRAKEILVQLTRQLDDIGRRGPAWVEQGRLMDLQATVSAIGRKIAELSYLGLGEERSEWVEVLREIGHRLHLVDMIRFTLGGDEIAELLELVEESAERLRDLVDMNT